MPDTSLGVCYYPEHWPESDWSGHAVAMREAGLSLVRLGEFAWSRIEPARDRFEWDWLDRAIDTLAAERLGVILCTPTACPPAWLVEEAPDILPVDRSGRGRGFGSRRHYCFSSSRYAEESLRIVRAMAERYGRHPAVVGWQTDNEYGCHDTTLSFGSGAAEAFREWLIQRYGNIERLNLAWGTVFWSQEYQHFGQVPLPGHSVTVGNPALELDFRRFASEQVVRYNALQAGALREEIDDNVWLSHNFMGNFTDFDHYAVASDLDIAAWDSYPLGFLETSWFDDDTRRKYRRTGHPDWAAFHHDLYRGVGSGRFGVMEQQPGAVNWAPANAAPLPGMVRLWTWEALAHGAEFVSYFRWRQVPFAQEQMHAGLTRIDGSPAPALDEVRQVSEELGRHSPEGASRARVALVFDYLDSWVSDIVPHTEGFSALRQAFEYYGAARRLGLDIDVVPWNADLSRYEIVIAPCAMIMPADAVHVLENSGARIIFGPRACSRTGDMQIPSNLPPGDLQSLLPLRVVSVDSIAPHTTIRFSHGTQQHRLHTWHEQVETDLIPIATTAEGSGVCFVNDRYCYVAGCVDQDFLIALFDDLCKTSGIPTQDLPDGLRIRRRGPHTYVFNYGAGAAEFQLPGARLELGAESLAAGDLAIWRHRDD